MREQLRVQVVVVELGGERAVRPPGVAARARSAEGRPVAANQRISPRKSRTPRSSSSSLRARCANRIQDSAPAIRHADGARLGARRWSWDGTQWTLVARTGLGSAGHALFSDNGGTLFFAGGTRGMAARWTGNQWQAVSTDPLAHLVALAAAFDRAGDLSRAAGAAEDRRSCPQPERNRGGLEDAEYRGERTLLFPFVSSELRALRDSAVPPERAATTSRCSSSAGRSRAVGAFSPRAPGGCVVPVFP